MCISNHKVLCHISLLLCSHSVIQPQMPPFNMVVGAWPLEVEVVPLVTLELPVHRCVVKVRHQLIHVRDLRCLLLHS